MTREEAALQHLRREIARCSEWLRRISPRARIDFPEMEIMQCRSCGRRIIRAVDKRHGRSCSESCARAFRRGRVRADISSSPTERGVDSVIT